jgi:hypothetical protein
MTMTRGRDRQRLVVDRRPAATSTAAAAAVSVVRPSSDR